MKTKTITTHKKARGAVISSLALFGMLLMVPSVNAATAIPYFQDFQPPDDVIGIEWVVSNPSSSTTDGTATVDIHNSQPTDPDPVDDYYAYAYRSGAGTTTISQEFDFIYGPNARLSFFMQAYADTLLPNNQNTGAGSTTLESSSGVTISFVTNTGTESLTLQNASDTLTNPPIDIGAGVHFYDDLLSNWATAAGVADVSTVSTFSLEFFATADTDPLLSTRRSTASVWFDDVRVVPVPASIWLLGSGLVGLIGVARRKKAIL